MGRSKAFVGIPYNGNHPRKKSFANVFLHFLSQPEFLYNEITWIAKVFLRTTAKKAIHKTFLPRMIPRYAVYLILPCYRAMSRYCPGGWLSIIFWFNLWSNLGYCNTLIYILDLVTFTCGIEFYILSHLTV